MPTKIKARYTMDVPEEHYQVYAHSLKVEIVDAEGCSDHLFVFQRSKENEIGDCVDEFIQIASPLDIEEVPEDAPRLDENMPYYRSKSVTLWFRCLEDLELAKSKIKEDLSTLAYTYDVLNGAHGRQEEETYPPEDDSSRTRIVEPVRRRHHRHTEDSENG